MILISKEKIYMNVPLVPLNDQIVVSELDQADDMTSAGGIIMQTQKENKQNSRKAEVLAVGPGKLTLLDSGKVAREPIQVKVGDIVVYREYAPMQVTVKGTPYLILGVENVAGIINKDVYDS